MNEINEINGNSVSSEDTEENTDEKIIAESSDEDDAVSEYNDAASEYAALEEALKKAEDERDEYKEKYIRLLAEYDNYRKRTAKEKTETYSNATAKCIEELLPFIDSFERALSTECADEAYKNGMDMIFRQLLSFLEKMNVTEVEALGTEFDPNFHNAVRQLEDTDYTSGHVCEVYQKGYFLGDKLIRAAMVAVAV